MQTARLAANYTTAENSGFNMRAHTLKYGAVQIMLVPISTRSWILKIMFVFVIKKTPSGCRRISSFARAELQSQKLSGLVLCASFHQRVVSLCIDISLSTWNDSLFLLSRPMIRMTMI